ncbi:hypothetical protein [Streptomyces chartreusis]|uniref:hypothetical protein n=1 Tax=Streptomyces chartreusis TaxID=1969 RepID=UPI00382F520C
MNDNVTLAADWFSILNGIGTDARFLIFEVAIPVLCGIFVWVIGWKTRAPGPTIMAVIFAGIVWGLSANLDTLRDTTGDTVTQYDKGGGSVIEGDQ